MRPSRQPTVRSSTPRTLLLLAAAGRSTLAAEERLAACEPVDEGALGGVDATRKALARPQRLDLAVELALQVRVRVRGRGRVRVRVRVRVRGRGRVRVRVRVRVGVGVGLGLGAGIGG